jgi:hypothetical protein
VVDAVDEGVLESEERSICSAAVRMSSLEVRKRDMETDLDGRGAGTILERLWARTA